jgi:hypothetical protein
MIPLKFDHKTKKCSIVFCKKICYINHRYVTKKSQKVGFQMIKQCSNSQLSLCLEWFSNQSSSVVQTNWSVVQVDESDLSEEEKAWMSAPLFTFNPMAYNCDCACK